MVYNFGETSSNNLSFYLNGTKVKLDGNSINPDATLLDFIRSQPNLTGTKNGCSEGGCGACTVVLQSKHPLTDKLTHLAINACIAPLISIDGKHVITVEMLGDSQNPHPLQERLSSSFQCGFCATGIVMSVYAMLRDAKDRGSLTVEDIEMKGALDGNLCRCTGYKPILEAVKSFVGEYTSDKEVKFNFQAGNLDLEDFKSCCEKKETSLTEISTDISLPVPSGATTSVPPIVEATGRTAPKESNIKPLTGCGKIDCCQVGGNSDKENGKPSKNIFPRFSFKPYQPGTELIFPPGLRNHQMNLLVFGNEERTWVRPTTLDMLLKIKSQYPEAKIIGGSTELQIEVKFKSAKFPLSVYVGDIKELYQISVPTSTKPFLEFGANLPLAELEILCQVLAKELGKERSGPFEAIATQLRYFAGKQVRNVASVGGNIATASPISDLNPVWIATNAIVVAKSLERGEFQLPLRDFFIGYRKTTLPPHAVITKIIVPLLDGDEEREVVRAYKQSKRQDDDIAIVTSCFLMRSTKENIISTVRIAFGGMHAWTISAKKTEEYLLGKPFCQATLDVALEILANSDADLSFSVPGGSPSYRKTLALSFLFKFFHSVSAVLQIPLGEDIMKEIDLLDITSGIHRGISSGTRDSTFPNAQEVVGKPLQHLSGLKHVTGEAVFVDDMPKSGNEAYGALVLSTHAHAKILSVDASIALDMEGVYQFISHLDLPTPKANWWGAAAIDEVFLAVDKVTSQGQPIGMIVAKDKLTAQRASKAVLIQYEDLPTIITIEEAVEAQQFHMQYDRSIVRGDPITEILKASDNVLSGTTRTGGQEHFYLETMAAFVRPLGESGEMEVYSSTQDLTGAQRFVAQITGVPRNRIVAKSKRMGGGFGGKETRAAQLTCITALAAHVSRRAVRCMLERSEDILTTGQRHPMLVNWKVGFTNEGKLTGLQSDFYSNAGYSLDLSGGVLDRALAHVDGSYYIPNVNVRARACKTNTVSNTAYRGFGGPQGMVVAEHYMEAIAQKLNLDINHVRETNLYKEGQTTPYHQQVLDWHIPRMLKECRKECNYDERQAHVELFNKEHLYRKRGMCLLPTKFGLAFGVTSMNQGAAFVNIYTDGSVLVAHGGTEMGQGLYTKCLQLAAQELGVPIQACFTSETSTNTVPNAVPTAGSAGSDLQGYAVHNACVTLNERLAPIRKRLGPNATMGELASAAWGDRISLSATGFFATPNLGYVWNNQERTGDLFHYFTLGVAASEVEIDVLTGYSTVLRTDILMDVGKSLNPLIDFGQIEGAFTQGLGWCTMEESLWYRKTGTMHTTGPGTYKIPGFCDIPQIFNVSLLRDAEYPNLGSIKASKGIGEPPFFLGCSVALAIRNAINSARADSNLETMEEFRLPMTSERIRMSCGDALSVRGTVVPKEGEEDFFVSI